MSCSRGSAWRALDDAPLFEFAGFFCIRIDESELSANPAGGSRLTLSLPDCGWGLVIRGNHGNETTKRDLPTQFEQEHRLGGMHGTGVSLPG